jgi:predicted AAA+ superfamily ATPase
LLLEEYYRRYPDLRGRETSYWYLDDSVQRDLTLADPERLRRGKRPILIDEWQRVPESWDIVRRAVDEGPDPGYFLLTGSAAPAGIPTHSGAGRIVRVRMRPLMSGSMAAYFAHRER